ncbi:hypothetical protein HMPREF4655_20477 [Helicobacter pylori 35A]|nr:hypothetical protein HMPREF4655_20477 [Helicobacter pylori 35A]
MERSIGLCRVLKQKVFFTTKIKEPAPTSFLITHSYGVRGSLGVVGELFQNVSYLFMGFKNPIF